MVPARLTVGAARSLVYLTLGLGLLGKVHAFDNSRNDNLAVYWGQDGGGNQQSLGYYCQDDTINAIPIAFLYQFFGQGGQPVIDLSNICGQWSQNVFPGTKLSDCSFIANDIRTCQSKGKIITLSLGGAEANVGFQSDQQASDFADNVWDMFLGGNSDMRPFGSAVLDGVDLDIENGSPNHYATFVNRIRTRAKGANKRYYVTAAPQCPFPDANVGAALNGAPFDAVYVQFYNNDCGLNHPWNYNFNTWDNWAKTQSPNPNVKVYIGAAASQDAAGQGYVSAATLRGYALDAQKKYSSFGGVMLWDASVAWSNNRYDRAIKQSMSQAGGSPSPSPDPNPDPSNPNPNPNPPSNPSPEPNPEPVPIPAPPPGHSICLNVAAWSRRSLYTEGARVFFNGHLWTAQWWSWDDVPGGPESVWHNNGTCTPASAIIIQASSSEIQTPGARDLNGLTHDNTVHILHARAISPFSTVPSGHPHIDAPASTIRAIFDALVAAGHKLSRLSGF